MDIFDIIKSVIIGIVEGITEWLPISSTGHIILTDRLIPLDASDAFKEMFNVVIQLGAIMAVVVLFFDKLWPFTSKNQGFIKKQSISLWTKVIVAVLPAAVIGIPFDDWFTAKFHNEWVISAMLILYGILFIVVESYNKNRISKVNTLSEISYKTALLIGAFQVLSLIPGTSRSGATILGAILLGVSRTAAAEFSFYLAVPVMFGASLIKILKFGFNITGMEFVVLAVGMITAFIVSIIAIKFLLGYVKKRDFKFFGYYRIALGLLVLVYFSFIPK
ncbi:MAG: undecaprenyl-diphosphate phosphatase [Clostridia bacterium]|nr:undecaprenyl-diphosphate phosphatase [Clostridia bacterium]